MQSKDEYNLESISVIFTSLSYYSYLDIIEFLDKAEQHGIDITHTNHCATRHQLEELFRRAAHFPRFKVPVMQHHGRYDHSIIPMTRLAVVRSGIFTLTWFTLTRFIYNRMMLQVLWCFLLIYSSKKTQITNKVYSLVHFTTLDLSIKFHRNPFITFE